MKIRNSFSYLLALVIGAGAFTAMSVQVMAQEEAREGRAYLGIRVAPISNQFRSTNEIDVRTGVLVKHVLPDTPADRSGIRQFDVIQKVNGDSVSTVQELSDKVHAFSPGETLSLTLHRDGETRTIKVELNKYGATEPSEDQRAERAKREKMKKLLDRMEETENGARSSGQKDDSSSRSPEELRREMKSFLEEHSSKATGEEQKKKNGEKKNGEQERVKKLLDNLKKKLKNMVGEKLDPEQVDKLLEEVRTLVRKVSKEDLRATLNRYVEKMQKRLKRMNGKTGRKLKRWKSSVQEYLKEKMSGFEQRLDNRMDEFEDRIKKRMEKYSDRIEKELQEKYEQLNSLKEEIRQLKEKKRKSKKEPDVKSSSKQPYLGIRPAADPAGKGILVREVKPDSPAERAGLKKGDVIRKMNGKPLQDISDLRKLFHEQKPGDKIELYVEREGWKRTMTVKLGHRKSNENSHSSSESQSGSTKSPSPANRFSFTEKDRKELFQRGKKAMWMMDLYADYQQGRYLEVLKKGILRAVDKLKEQVRETPLQLKGQFTVENEESGEVLLSMPLNQSLTQAVHRLDRVVTLLLGNE